MSEFSRPSEENDFLAPHIALLRRSYRHWTQRDWLDRRLSDRDAARYLYTAPIVALSHGPERDPVFTYANQTAQALFGFDWEEFTALPSRRSAASDQVESRQKLLAEVAERGFMDDYSGVRVGHRGRRFRIENAVVWNLIDERGEFRGQAASFAHWTWL